MKYLPIIYIFIVLIVLNGIDVAASRRSLKMQNKIGTLISAPLNALVHFGTPKFITDKLAISPILIPDTHLFPNVNVLRNNYNVIKQDALKALSLSRPIKNDLFFRNIADSGWKRFYLKWYGPPDEVASKHCSNTVKLLQGMPEVHLGMFSILMPGSKISAHHGPARMCLRYHMGIITPNDTNCRITIGGENYAWKDREDVMFDDTFIHEVVNNTDKVRIVLFLDIERPQYKTFEPLVKAMIHYGGPLTTRSNEKQEKVIDIK